MLAACSGTGAAKPATFHTDLKSIVGAVMKELKP
jgi:hypothetical protein